MKIRFYKDVELIGDVDLFTLNYTPDIKGGKPNRLILDADNEADALSEAASFLGCKETDLHVEWT